ncbi:MAG TPA: CDP-alcohol phosphatidyltransferase family protein [Hydrogenophaga sp.]|nr:CDP-alcohol phosphatidyltransferase family protein [Hydrogenophaga sp.]
MKPKGHQSLSPSVAAATGLSALQRDVLKHLLAAAAGVLMASSILVGQSTLDASHTIKAMAFFGAGAWLIWRALEVHPGKTGAHPHARFGPANRVTLVRLSVVVLLAALVGETIPPAPFVSAPAAAWAIVIVATLTALLDAVDGHLARRSGLASAFGARFDMETDAFFVLVLCALVIQAGQAGPWVLASGLMRYAFVGAARLWPWLSGPLQPSKRRQTVCVVQIITLIVCLGPIIAPTLAASLALLSLAVLTVSFAIDVRALSLHRPIQQET